jgi:hypothetical protein
VTKEPQTDRMVRSTDADRVVQSAEIDPLVEINAMAAALIEKINAVGVVRAASHVRLAVDMVNQHVKR